MAKEIILDLDYKSEEVLSFEKALNYKIIGQEDAKNSVTSALERAMYPLSDDKRTPLGVFLFIGPPGVGKTEVARTVAHYLLGSEDAFTKIDCGQYKERHQRSRLLGSPPSYVGYSTVPILSDVVLFKHTKKAIQEKKMNPLIHKHGEEFAIVLLDEFEKMHPELQDVFLAAFDEGQITLDNGLDEGNSVEAKKNGIKFSKHVNFRKTIFIITSNAGSQEIVNINSGKKSSMSFKEDNQQELNTKDFYENKLREFLRPEFLSRVEEIIPFRSLTHDEYILRLEYIIKESSIKLEKIYGVTMDLSKKAKEKLVKDSVSPEKGARLLNQNFEKVILGDLSKIMGSGQLTAHEQDHYHILVDIKKDTYVFKLKNVNKKTAKNKEKKGLIETKPDFNNLMVNVDYASYIDYQVEEVLPLLSSLNILYEFRDEVDENYIESINEIEATLQNIGFTELDFANIKKTGLKSKFDDLNSYIYNYSGIELREEYAHLDMYVKYVSNFIKNIFKNNFVALENKEISVEQLILDVEEYVKKILHKTLLNKEEIDMIITFLHREYINKMNEDEPVLLLELKPNKKGNVEFEADIFKDTPFNTKELFVDFMMDMISKNKDVGDIFIEFEAIHKSALSAEQTAAIIKMFLELKTEE